MPHDSRAARGDHGARCAALGRRRRRRRRVGADASSSVVGVLEARGVTSDPSGEGDAGDQDTIRERVTRLAFGGDQARYDEFIRAIARGRPRCAK